ncbi:hypothetical protein OG871_06830 [Kitasatospora sp. NBC_00374]|uniref:hypothetical protein n=1 Tax=Kitasatospora sp. NBC_00374 TaxID=2975964 RepID=UPI0030DF426A
MLSQPAPAAAFAPPGDDQGRDPVGKRPGRRVGQRSAPPPPSGTEARLTDLATTRKIIAEVTPAGTESEPPETNTTYQAIVNAFNQNPDQAFRVRELHELLGMPTDEASVNITRSRLGRLTRQGFLTQPGRGRYKKRT